MPASPSKHPFIALTIAAILVILVVVICFAFQSKTPSGSRPTVQTPVVQNPLEGELAPVSASAAKKANADLELATSSMHDRRLAFGLLRRLEKMVQDPKQDALTRNNAANALVGQDKKDPELWRLFLKMAQDPKEDEVWRDYCLQFLAACVPFASEAQTVTDYLATVAREEGIDRAGTAAIMLRRLTDDGLYNPPVDVIDTLIQQTKNEKIPPAARMSMLALVGRNGSATHAAFLREVIATTKDDDFLRVAIAGLGIIGNPDDLPLVNTGLKHPNKAVVLAAQGAQRRLSSRFPSPSATSAAAFTSTP